MSPRAIVECLDVLEEGAARFEVRPKGLLSKEFTLQGGEDALSQRIIVAVTHRAYGATYQAVGFTVTRRELLYRQRIACA